MAKRKQVASGQGEPDSAWETAWRQAAALRLALVDGYSLPTLDYSPVRLQQGETAHAHLVLDYSRFYGQRVTYQTNNATYFGSPLFVAAGLAGQAIGNSTARSRAEAMAAPQWREFQRVGAYLTDRRVLALVNGSRWLSWWHNANIQVQPLLDHWSVMQLFEENCEPLRWQGTGAPWLAVALVYLVYGADHLANHPELAALGALDS